MLEGTYRYHLVQHLKVGSARAGCQGSCPVGSWINTSKDRDSAASLGSLFNCWRSPFRNRTCNYVFGFGCSLAINCRGHSVRSGFEARTAISLSVEAELVVENLQRDLLGVCRLFLMLLLPERKQIIVTCCMLRCSNVTYSNVKSVMMVVFFNTSWTGYRTWL